MLIQTSHEQRVAAYRRGWNDAAVGRPAARGREPIMYTIGYVECKRGVPNRFEPHEQLEEH